MFDVTPSHIGDVVDDIVRCVHPDRIILFGSRARGGSAPGSDIDLMVVMPVVGTKREARIRIGLALQHCSAPVDVLAATPDEMDRFGSIPGSLVYPAATEGKVLYERGL